MVPTTKGGGGGGGFIRDPFPVCVEMDAIVEGAAITAGPDPELASSGCCLLLGGVVRAFSSPVGDFIIVANFTRSGV